MTTIASLLLTTAPGAMLPGAAAPAPGAGGAVGDFLKLVLPGCGDGIAAGVARDPARQDLAGPGTGLPLVDADLANGDAALAWLADATGVTVPPPPTPAVVPDIAALPSAPPPDSRPEPRPDLGLRIVPAHTPVATPAAALEADAPIVAAEEEEPAAPTPRDVATDAAPPAPPAAIMPPLPVAMSAAPAEAHPAEEAPTTKRGIEATASSPIMTPSASPEVAVQDEAPSPPDVTQTPVARKEAQALPSGGDLPAPPSAPVPPQPATASASPAPSSEPTTTVAPVRAATPPEKPDLARTGAATPDASSTTDTPSNIMPPPPVAAQRARVAGAARAAPAAAIPVDGVTAVPDTVKPSPAVSVEAAPAAPTRAGTRPTIVLAPATGAAAVSQAAAPVAPERSIAMGPDPVAGRAAPAPASTSPRRADPDTIATTPAPQAATAPIAPSILDTPLSTTPRPLTPAPVMATAAATLRVDAPLPTAPSQPIDMATPPSAPASDTPVIAAAAALRVDTPLPVATAPTAATTIPASPATPTTAPAPVPATAATPHVDAPPPIASVPPAAPSATATQATSPLTPPPTEAPAAPADAAPARAPSRAVAPPPASAESSAPVVAPVIAPVIASAARTFAEAIHRAVTADDRARPADAIGQPQATAAISAVAVASTGQAQQQTLDMRQPQWPGAMIQHIEKLRDMADANDMRIRVVPDALGTIDVALHREGDTVQVQLTAEQPQTRALLAEAQPRLTEMAEARGLKLQHGATSGGASNPQGDRQPQQQQQQQRSAPLPAAPVSARRGGAAGADDTEQRLA